MSEDEIFKLAAIQSKRQATTGNYDLDSAVRFYIEIGYIGGYHQGRKDAIDEVLVLIKSVEATMICEDEWSEWLQNKLGIKK